MVVENIANVVLVDAKSERIGGDHDGVRLTSHESLLLLVAKFLCESPVVSGYGNVVSSQFLGQLVNGSHSSAVDNPGLRKFLKQCDEDFVLLVVAWDRDALVVQIGTVVACGNRLRVGNAELVKNVIPNMGRGSRRYS